MKKSIMLLSIIGIIGCSPYVSAVQIVMPDGHSGVDVVCHERRYCLEAISKVCSDGFEIKEAGGTHYINGYAQDLEMVASCKIKPPS